MKMPSARQKRVAKARRRCLSAVAKKSSTRLARFQRWKARKYPGKKATKSMYKEYCRACSSGSCKPLPRK